MANNVLTFSPSTLVLNKASFSSPSKVGLGPKNLTFRGPNPILSKTPSLSRMLMVVRAELDEGGLSKEISHVDPLVRKDLSHIDHLLPLHLNKRVAMIDTSLYMRTPWNTSEDENEIRMWFDMPGIAAPEIDVKVVGNFLIIKGNGEVDALGRKIHSPFDCKLHLPFNCAKDETQAVLKNGILYISVPKITKAEHVKFIDVPVKAI